MRSYWIGVALTQCLGAYENEKQRPSHRHRETRQRWSGAPASRVLPARADATRRGEEGPSLGLRGELACHAGCQNPVVVKNGEWT